MSIWVLAHVRLAVMDKLSYGARAMSESECLHQFLELRLLPLVVDQPKKNSEVILNGELKLETVEETEKPTTCSKFDLGGIYGRNIMNSNTLHRISMTTTDRQWRASSAANESHCNSSETTEQQPTSVINSNQQ